MARKSTPKDALSCALRILALREHTVFELKQKLHQRDFGEDEIEAAITQCRAWNYLDDDRAARVLARTLLRKGAGVNKIRFELAKRQIPETTVHLLLDELDITDNQLDTALNLVAKKFVKAETFDEKHKQKGKIYRYLQNKGYGADIIYQVFNRFYKN